MFVLILLFELFLLLKAILDKGNKISKTTKQAILNKR